MFYVNTRLGPSFLQYFEHRPQSHRTLNRQMKYLFIHTAINHFPTSVDVLGRTAVNYSIYLYIFFENIVVVIQKP